MKSGTSTLSDYLSLHKDIFIPKRELHFFNNDKLYNKGIEEYEKYFEEAESTQIKGEKTPTYSYLEKVPKRIFEMNPNIKIIWTFREPVARAYSNYWHNIVNGGEIFSFETCIEKEKYFLEKDIFRAYLDRSIYIKQVRRYLDFFKKDQMHFILFEDLVKNPQEILDQTLNFLDRSGSSSELSKKQIVSNQRKSLPISKNLQYTSRKVFGKRLPFKLIKRLNKRNVKKYPSLDPNIKEELRVYFESYNKELEEVIEKDLTSVNSLWNKK